MSGQPGGLVNRDLEHLKLLATFHYIVGALTAIWFSIPLIHVAIGLIFMLSPDLSGPDSRQAFPARLFGLIFVLIGGGLVLLGWTLGGLTIYAGRCLSRHEKYVFCIVVACINCMHVPLGTILGVFTLVVLFRDSVRPLFGANRAAATPQAPTGS